LDPALHEGVQYVSEDFFPTGIYLLAFKFPVNHKTRKLFSPRHWDQTVTKKTSEKAQKLYLFDGTTWLSWSYILLWFLLIIFLPFFSEQSSCFDAFLW